MKWYYISHPYTGNEEENRKKAADVQRHLHEMYADIMCINPLAMFAPLVDIEEHEKGDKVQEIDMTKPQPCTKFAHAGTVERIAKLVEETNEVIQEAYIVSQHEQSNKEFPCEAMNEVIQDARERLALELTDVIHVCISWLDAEGWDEEARGELHRRVNEKNRDRGYL